MGAPVGALAAEVAGAAIGGAYAIGVGAGVGVGVTVGADDASLTVAGAGSVGAGPIDTDSAWGCVDTPVGVDGGVVVTGEPVGPGAWANAVVGAASNDAARISSGFARLMSAWCPGWANMARAHGPRARECARLGEC